MVDSLKLKEMIKQAKKNKRVLIVVAGSYCRGNQVWVDENELLALGTGNFRM
jgi:hypothetical protein